MVVVADTSPFIGLVKIGLIDVLLNLYGSVIIPSEVADELRDAKRPQEVRAFIATQPKWLIVKRASKIELIEGLGAGERAAMADPEQFIVAIRSACTQPRCYLGHTPQNDGEPLPASALSKQARYPAIIDRAIQHPRRRQARLADRILEKRNVNNDRHGSNRFRPAHQDLLR